MKNGTTGPNRLSRVVAKEVPHRSDERFFAARSAVKAECEGVLHDMRHSAAHAPAVADLTAAVTRAMQQLQEITPTQDHAPARVRDLGREVQHLRLAHSWVAATERVLTRLSVNCAREMRDELLQAQDEVMWFVRARRWNGELTASVTRLQKVVQRAEAQAARVVV